MSMNIGTEGLAKSGGNKAQADALAAKMPQKAKMVFQNVIKYLEKVPDKDKPAYYEMLGVTMSAPDPIVFTMPSGKAVEFVETYLEPEKLTEQHVVVEKVINGREQDRLTEQSLRDILVTIGAQQFYPAIGYVNENGVIVLQDGSRRLAAAKIKGVGLKVLVTYKKISALDAIQFTRWLQSAKELTLRENGSQWKALRDEHKLTQKNIALSAGVSESEVSKAIKATEIDELLLRPIEDLSMVTREQWEGLHEIQYKQLPKKRVTVSEFLESIDIETIKDTKGNISVRDLLSLYKSAFTKATKKISTEKNEIKKYSSRVKLDEEIAPNAYKVILKGVKSNNKELIKEVQDKVQEIMDKYFDTK